MQAALNMASFKINNLADPVASQDGMTLHYANTNYSGKGGGTLTGNLTLTPPGNASLTLNKAASTQANSFFGETAGLLRWAVVLGDTAAESGSNNGSNFEIVSYNDAGAVNLTAISIARSIGTTFINFGLVLTGTFTVSALATFNAGISVTGASSFTNSPTVPTPSPGDNTTKAATTAFVTAALAAPLALAATSTAVTPAAADNSTLIATTAWVSANIGELNASVAALAIGSYCVAHTTLTTAIGATIAGSSLTTYGSVTVGGTTPSGTWRCMGGTLSNSQDYILWLRIA